MITMFHRSVMAFSSFGVLHSFPSARLSFRVSESRVASASSPKWKWTRQDAFHGPVVGMSKQYDNAPSAIIVNETQPFSLTWPSLDTDSADEKTSIDTEPVCNKTSTSKSKSNGSTNYEILGSGMILLKKYISLEDQVSIVNICQRWGAGPGGFYEPSFQNGAKLRLRMMCFGRNWDPVTKYNNHYRSDGSEPPPVPYELVSLTETTIQDAQTRMGKLPSMHPDICIVNFYSPAFGRLGLHQDRDESSDSIQKGLPVVSISIGDTAEFLYGYTRNNPKSVLLHSGDVLIFGGRSRLVYHGVKQVFPDTAPTQLLQQTALRPGRLNLTLRQF